MQVAVNIRYGECILSVLRHGSITAASKNLYISQSALSQMIKRAERELGAEIFNRDTDPISLTFAGERYLDAIRQVAAINTNLLNEVSEINGEMRGCLRLGISVQRGMQLLPLIIPEFARRYPKVRIELTERGSTTLERLMHEGVFDLGLITTEPRFSDLVYDLLETEEVVLVAGIHSRLAKKLGRREEISIMEAADEPFVSLRAGHSVRKVQDTLFQEHMIDPPVLLETDSLEAAKRLAATGAALMLCPNVYVAQDRELREHLICYRVKGMDYRRNFYACWRQDMPLPRFMTDLIHIIKKKLEEAQHV